MDSIIKNYLYSFRYAAHVITFLFLVSSNANGFIHGDLDERIAETTQEIEITPDSAFLFFKRGKLYYEHEEYAKSIEDLNQAQTLGFEDFHCDLVFAKAYQKFGKYNQALEYVNKVLTKDDSKVVALNIKAGLLFDKKEYELSALTYEELIQKSIRTLPENYLSAAQSWELLNAKEKNKKAIAILEKGIEDLGSLFQFHNKMIEIYITDSDYQAALQIQQQLIDTSNRKEVGYFKAAEICLLSNNKIEANQYLEKSLIAIQKLPSRIRNNRAMKNLKLKIERKLHQLK